ncbi:MAG TPA: patatin-like phospholipase family protein, partial [Alphaproteobacteria bacterium]|nr:patatin-like phospholipase family protein [Alphaproteobacteria bacterium]
MKLPPPGAPVPASTHAGDTPFDAVVFAGGGCRCFWQAGFWSVAAPAIGIAPSVVAGVSAGAAFATASLLGVAERVLEDFKRRTAVNPRNVYPRNVLRGSPAFPHEDMYRGAILASLDDVDFARVRTGPD